MKSPVAVSICRHPLSFPRFKRPGSYASRLRRLQLLLALRSLVELYCLTLSAESIRSTAICTLIVWKAKSGREFQNRTLLGY